jgi:hypothetical protein
MWIKSGESSRNSDEAIGEAEWVRIERRKEARNEHFENYDASDNRPTVPF